MNLVSPGYIILFMVTIHNNETSINSGFASVYLCPVPSCRIISLTEKHGECWNVPPHMLSPSWYNASMDFAQMLTTMQKILHNVSLLLVAVKLRPLFFGVDFGCFSSACRKFMPTMGHLPASDCRGHKWVLRGRPLHFQLARLLGSKPGRHV